MMADDNSVVVELISDYLKVNQFNVSAVNSGSDLLANLDRLTPDILLLDIQMPGMNGLDVIRAIRANKSEHIASLPIIAITALAMSGDRERCLSAGANEYMSKPIRLQELLDLINEFCPPSTRRGGFQTHP